MKASLLGKRALSSVLTLLGIPERRLKNATGEKSLILMYHRVIDGAVARPLGQEGMYVDPATFENHLRFLTRRFRVVPLEETVNLVQHPSRGYPRADGPLCSITFDDGWRDVYENAYPLLQKYGMPATVFLPTGFVGTGKHFWTDRLARLLTTENSAAKEHAARTLGEFSLPVPGIFKRTEGESVHAIVESMKRLAQEEIEYILSALSEEIGTDPDEEERAFLTWEEVREMYGSGVVRFGSHTESHRILTTLSDDEVVSELRRSRERLIAEGSVEPTVIPFAYPNGNYSDRIAAMVAEAGYSIAVTTEKGWNLERPVADAYRLRRIGVHEDVASTEATFGCRLAEMI